MPHVLAPFVGFFAMAFVFVCCAIDTRNREKQVTFVVLYLHQYTQSWWLDLFLGSEGLLTRDGVHLLLRQLEDEGLLQSRESGHGINVRRIYSLTPEGKVEAILRRDARDLAAAERRAT